MGGIQTIDQLQALFRRQGVSIAYVRLLALKQDNAKNQIYFGRGLDGVTNLFPAKIEVRSPSQSTKKPKSSVGQPKLEAKIDFAWIGRDGARYDAPDTKIIDYFQFPEVRFSGFKKYCLQPPTSLDRDTQHEFGQRILVIGTALDGKVLGFVLTEREDPVVAVFPDLPFLFGSKGIFRVLSTDGEVGIAPTELLRREIQDIALGGWFSSRINKGGKIVPFSGNQGGGYTLEALLGVAANAKKAPDKHGFEVKGYSGSRISLMTPTPDLGYQGDHNFREFMERWGRLADKGDGSLRFVGLHRSGVKNERTGLTLRVKGYVSSEDRFEDAENVRVELVNEDTQEFAAGWSIQKLANSWNAKHANALYIGFVSREGINGVAEYKYADQWLIGRGTDVWKLLRAIARGVVYYDPADAIYQNNKAKVRPQWRINASNLAEGMKHLYTEVEVVKVI